MFDKFQPLQRVPKQNFAFQPVRYETWIGGQMVASGKTKSLISANVITQDNTEKVEISFNDLNLEKELASKNMFDEFVTSNERLQLITIPKETNVENMGIMALTMALGVTRQKKNFSHNEPYCCNLFLQQGAIVKMTFSFSNPEKLIEFYQ
jgi:hypothetical protein